MSRHRVPHYGYSAQFRRGHDAISRPDRPTRDRPLTPGVALLVIVLLSLGLWWVISLAVSSLGLS